MITGPLSAKKWQMWAIVLPVSQEIAPCFLSTSDEHVAKPSFIRVGATSLIICLISFVCTVFLLFLLFPISSLCLFPPPLGFPLPSLHLSSSFYFSHPHCCTSYYSPSTPSSTFYTSPSFLILYHPLSFLTPMSFHFFTFLNPHTLFSNLVQIYS